MTATSDAPLAIETRNLTKIYGADNTEVVAMRNASMQVRRGEVIALLGPSGSGKSTFLTAVGLINPPTVGQVWIDGRLILDGPVAHADLRLSPPAHWVRISKVEPDPISDSHRECPDRHGTERRAYQKCTTASGAATR